MIMVNVQGEKNGDNNEYGGIDGAGDDDYDYDDDDNDDDNCTYL